MTRGPKTPAEAHMLNPEPLNRVWCVGVERRSVSQTVGPKVGPS